MSELSRSSTALRNVTDRKGDTGLTHSDHVLVQDAGYGCGMTAEGRKPGGPAEPTPSGPGISVPGAAGSIVGNFHSKACVTHVFSVHTDITPRYKRDTGQACASNPGGDW